MGRITPAFLLAVLVAHADVTVRYSMSIEPGGAMPPQAAEQMKTQLKSMLGGTVQQIKGGRARSTGMGPTSITDFDGAIITLVDDKNGRYATASQQQYVKAWKDRMPKPGSDVEKSMPKVQVENSAKKTERTREIQGIPAEETEIVMTMHVAGMPFRLRAVMSVWTPVASEAEKHPAIAELNAYAQRAWEGTDVASTFKTMMKSMPGGGEGISELVDSLKKTGLLLEMNATMSIPGFREILAKMAPDAATAFPAGGDDVMMTMSQKLTEISTAELPESLFIVPRDYTAVDLSEMMGEAMRSLQARP